MTLRCLIIEDQPAAQALLEKYVNDTPHLALAETCTGAAAASAVISKKSINLVFLDLHLPKIDGFSFLRSLLSPPLVIVTTADPDHALEGFNLNIVDYLLKPFSYERFLQAVSKAVRLTDTSKVTNTSDANGGGGLFLFA